MRTRSSSNLVGESSPSPTTLNPKRRNRRRLKQPFILEEYPVDTMADQRTMAKLLRAPIEGYAEAIVVPPILADHFDLNNTIANPKGELKAITTQSGLVLDGPFVPMSPPSINLEGDECAEQTLTDPESLTVILKKLPEKLGDPGKFLISCGFSELKCKALAGLANRAICTPAGIARDVFVPVGKFTFPANFVIVDYESDPRVLLILGRPFLRTAHALIDVHGEEVILRDGVERLTLNMRYDTSSYSNQPLKESINMINIYNDSYEDYLEDLFATNHLSGNLTFSSHTDLTSPEVINLIRALKEFTISFLMI
nr:reverse transcriptase domain-containing protein [Tanacetum cinerariifolium]